MANDKPVAAMTIEELTLQRERKRKASFKRYHLRRAYEHRLLEQKLTSTIDHIKTHGDQNSTILNRYIARAMYHSAEMKKHMKKLQTGMARTYRKMPEWMLQEEAEDLRDIDREIWNNLMAADIYPRADLNAEPIEIDPEDPRYAKYLIGYDPESGATKKEWIESAMALERMDSA